MYKRTLTLLALSSLLGACALSPAHTETNYTLQPPPQHSSSRPGKAVPLSLQVAAVDAPTWLEGRNMYYQFLYSEQDRVLAYSQSRWLASPPTMLANLLVNQLSGANLWRVVVGPSSNVSSDYMLHVHLTEFQQVFKTSKRSYGILAARASLVDGKTDAVVAEKVFRFEVAARSPDAQGGAEALSKASGELAAAVARWLQRTPPMSSATH